MLSLLHNLAVMSLVFCTVQQAPETITVVIIRYVLLRDICSYVSPILPSFLNDAPKGDRDNGMGREMALTCQTV